LLCIEEATDHVKKARFKNATKCIRAKRLEWTTEQRHSNYCDEQK